MEPNENAILATVERFARREISPRLPGPEASLDDATMGRILEAARAAGVLASDGADTGLWRGEDPAERLHLGLAMLETLSVANTGVAFQLHAVALGSWLARRAGLEGAGALPVPALAAGTSLGRGAVARVLAGAPLQSDDAQLACAMFVNAAEPSAELLVQASAEWDGLVVPTIEVAGAQASIGWALVTRSSARAQSMENPHGLDEARLFGVYPLQLDRRSPLAPDAARTLFIEALGLHQLALVALGAGALRRGLSIARAYAHDRVQGGKRIEEHEAIQLMLGEADAVLSAAELALRGTPAPAATPGALASAVGVRSVLGPALSRAASLCIQVLGGMGYMRDAGLEKVFRDCNHLRALAGSPDELRLLAAELRRATR